MRDFPPVDVERDVAQASKATRIFIDRNATVTVTYQDEGYFHSESYPMLSADDDDGEWYGGTSRS